MRFLTEEGQGNVLKISDDLLNELKEKHPCPAAIFEESLLINRVPETYFSMLHVNI